MIAVAVRVEHGSASRAKCVAKAIFLSAVGISLVSTFDFACHAESHEARGCQGYGQHASGGQARVWRVWAGVGGCGRV
jgi:hypothetical protein